MPRSIPSGTRDDVVSRLEQDLIGPGTPNESLGEKPSDVYLTGILYPQRTDSTPDDQEMLTGPEDSEDDEHAEDVPAIALRKPASMGLSFRIHSDAPATTIRVLVSGGYYRPEASADGPPEDDAVTRVVTEPTSGRPTFGRPDGAGVPPDLVPRRARRTQWQRVACDADVEIDVTASVHPPIELDLGGLEGFYIVSTSTRDGGDWLLTVTLVNGNELRPHDTRKPDELSLFQAALQVVAGPGAAIVARSVLPSASDDETNAMRLLYRDVRTFAVGHTCSVSWQPTDSDTTTRITTTWLPCEDVALVSAGAHPVLQTALARCIHDPLSADVAAEWPDDFHADLLVFVTGYEEWIIERRREIPRMGEAFRHQASLHLDRCWKAATRMRDGIEYLRRNPHGRDAFRLMSKSMAVQRRWTSPDRPLMRWRPFQLAFLLYSIRALGEPECDDRRTMDLLWFPTGGGKTEAYLGLIAFTLFLRRLHRARNADRGGGVAAIMRYSLRLLTLQQFERAAALIVACELIRRGVETPEGVAELREAAPFGIGLWVGSAATPNSVELAIAALNDPNAPSTPRQLSVCPCCRGGLEWVPTDAGDGIVARCRRDACEIATQLLTLPVFTVDEDIYRHQPALLIGTLDKFAQIVRSESAASLFNRAPTPPPDLIIQDELHLVSGPLGTLAALYEVAIDEICSRDGARPKIIGSTATIRSASDQVKGLFDRDVAQFPPPGLDPTDSCFAFVPEEYRTRRYCGLTTAGRSAKFALQAAYGSLLQSGVVVARRDLADGYYTLVGYFNSLRELGGAIVLVQDDVDASLKAYASRRAEAARASRELEELTSRIRQSTIRDVLDRLFKRYTEPDAVDVVLATNMISVGVDVPRLALMTVMGQPKGMSEYIQATSRVGRGDDQGLVVVVLNAAKARDRSHFESFKAAHAALYRAVEPTSVTPFASRARDRALHAALVGGVRNLVEALLVSPRNLNETMTDVDAIAQRIAQRAERCDPAEAAAVRMELHEMIGQWRARAPQLRYYWNDATPTQSLLISAERAAAQETFGRHEGRPWPTLNSLRNVEAGSPIRLVERLAADRGRDA